MEWVFWASVKILGLIVAFVVASIVYGKLATKYKWPL